MEWTVYNESLVYYALRNKDGYLCFSEGSYKISHNLFDVITFESLYEVKNEQEIWKQDFGELQIRKVKVIDIGEV